MLNVISIINYPIRRATKTYYLFAIEMNTSESNNNTINSNFISELFPLFCETSS